MGRYTYRKPKEIVYLDSSNRNYRQYTIERKPRIAAVQNNVELAPLTLPTSASASTFMPATNCPGGDPGAVSYFLPSPETCSNICTGNPNCRLWTYSHNNQQCRLKNGVWPCAHDPHYTSGTVTNRPNVQLYTNTVEHTPYSPLYSTNIVGNIPYNSPYVSNTFMYNSPYASNISYNPIYAGVYANAPYNRLYSNGIGAYGQYYH